MNWNKTARWLRLLAITGLLAWVTWESYLHQVLGGGKAPSVHALCPFGALESLYTLLFLGTYVQKIYSGTMVLLVLTVVITILFRRSFCGLLCPFGALQELFGLLGQKIFKKRLVVPLKLDRPLRYLKYAALALTLVMAWFYGKLWMAPYDPYSAYSHITVIAATIAEDPLSVVGFVLLAVTLLGSILYDRFFCKYLCPMGIFYGIIGKISPTIVERNDDLCIHCKSCNKACPVNIDVEKAVKVTSIECINCNECVLVCPKKGALEVKTAKKAVHPLAILLIVVGLFFGTIWAAQATGNYQVMPSTLKEGEIISITEVKGFFTIEDAAIATGLSLEEVYEILGIPKNVPKSTTFKEISNVAPGYDFDAAKAKAGGADTAVDDTGPADSGKVDISGVKGSMTIREAADSLQMDLQEFYALFQIPSDVPAQTKMKDIGTVSPGYDLEKIKGLLQ
jgi:polyferredoxin